MPRPAALYNRRTRQLIGKSQWCCSAMLQLQHAPPPQSTTPGLHPVSIHQMAPPVRGSKHPITAYYSVYRPRKDERLSRPGWLVTYRNKVPPPVVEPGHVTHPSTNRARRRINFVDTTNDVTTTPRQLADCRCCQWAMSDTGIQHSIMYRTSFILCSYSSYMSPQRQS